MIRLATNADGPQIGELVLVAGFDVHGLDWSNIEPYWLVADEDDEVVGCVQVLPGLPIGRLELLALDEDLTHRQQAVIVRDLLEHGAATLTLGGAQLAAGLIPFTHKTYKRILKKRGCVVIATGNMLAKPLH